jgi:aspartyl-tRNA(Asn)/glutamyl-tRNA(Gln) amidotransferase subunit A
VEDRGHGQRIRHETVTVTSEIPPGIFLARPDPLPTAGIRLAVKDLFDTAGLTTTYGSAIFADHVPTRTADAVQRLEAAGYTTVGKTNLHEFAYGTTSENEHFGAVPNPAAPGRVAGGSSGGNAAALALALVDAALGTDSGGSVRIPAACCGVVGFKPTYGLIPVEGCFPLAPSFDHAGPMARDVATCAAMMGPLAPGFEPRTLESLVGEAASLFPRHRALDLPSADAITRAFQREVADVHRELYAEHGDLYGASVATKIERCLAVTEAEYEQAVRAREEYREQILGLMSQVDLVVTPTLGCVAPPLGVGDLVLRDLLVQRTLPFNAIGAPALALPCGPAEDGLPASVQLAGTPGADALVLAAGNLLSASLEQAVVRTTP